MMYKLTFSYKTGVIATLLKGRKLEEMEIEFGNDKIYFSLTHTSGSTKIFHDGLTPDIMMTDLFDTDVSYFKNSGESTLLISDRFYQLLQDFNLPPHNCFDTMFNVDKKRIDSSHKLVVFEGKLAQHVIHELTTFKLVARDNKKKILSKHGPFQSREEMKLLAKEYREKGMMLLVDEYRIKNNYDLFWGGDSFLYINEQVNKKINEANLSGVDLRPNDNFVILPVNDQAQ